MFVGEEPSEGWPPLTEEEIENLTEKIRIKSVEVLVRETTDALSVFGALCARGCNLTTVAKSDTNPLKRRVLLKVPAEPGSATMFSNSILTTEDLLAMIPEEKAKDWSIVDHSIEIPLLKLTLIDGLKRILQGVELGVTEYPSSFETCGHIAHFNLLKEMMPYRRIVGQMCLRLNKHIKTVVVKVENLNDEYSKFRVLPMELVAGEDRFVAKLKEGGLSVQITYDKVYWNSRLSHEREVQVKRLYDGGEKKESVLVVDLMAGVGMLPIMLKSSQTKKKSVEWLTVISNDLNPAACADQLENARLNGIVQESTVAVTEIKELKKLAPNKFIVTNLDARELMSAVLLNNDDLLEDIVKEDKPLNIIFYMNLPAIAIEFLDVLREIDWVKLHPAIKIQINCYTFAIGGRNEESIWKKAISERASHILGYLPASTEIRFIRNVAPNKQMCCFEFEIPDKCSAPPAKKRKIGE